MRMAIYRMSLTMTYIDGPLSVSIIRIIKTLSLRKGPEFDLWPREIFIWP